MPAKCPAGRSARTAAIIYHPKALGSVHLAERLDIPAFLAFTLPEMIPTRAFPNPMLPFANHGPFDRLSHELFLRYANGLYRNQSIGVTEAIMSAVNDPEMPPAGDRTRG
jgi:hypothetical protein